MKIVLPSLLSIYFDLVSDKCAPLSRTAIYLGFLLRWMCSRTSFKETWVHPGLSTASGRRGNGALPSFTRDREGSERPGQVLLLPLGN